MRAPLPPVAACVTIALAACVGAGGRPALSRLLADAPGDVPPRFLFAGDRIASAAVPLGPGSLPPPVRTMFDAIAPGGKATFVGREWGDRGDGYRVEKAYQDGTATRTRSVLAAADGTVLERWHSVAIPDVPLDVMATALHAGPTIEEARIVSGPEREEYWTFLVRDRSGRLFVVRVGLDGAPLGRMRRMSGLVDS